MIPLLIALAVVVALGFWLKRRAERREEELRSLQSYARTRDWIDRERYELSKKGDQSEHQ